MKDNWLIEEVTNSDRCHCNKHGQCYYNYVLYIKKTGNYDCLDLITICTKEACPIRVKSDLAIYGNPESMQKEIWRLEEKIEKAGLTVREDD